jgi:thiopurine S-methyltransferase
MNEGWLERWQIGRIGWHEADGNRSLHKYWEASGRRVLVPLCGKSRDLLWLAGEGNEVVGVELSEIAAKAFFEESGVAYSRVDGELPSYVADDRSITIYCGDYFSFSLGDDLAAFDAYYDRGALVAVSPEIREAYVRHSQSLLSADAVKLIISVEYDQSVANGPPFSIPVQAMRSLWPELVRVDAYDDMDNCPPKFKEAGLSEIVEAVWRSA